MLKNLDSQDGCELTPISFEKLEKLQTSYGDLYWKKESGKLVKILHCGDYLDFPKLEKFKKVTQNLYISSVSNELLVKEGTSIIISLLKSDDERERLELRESFIELIAPTYWLGEESGSALDLVMIFKNAFYKISPEFEVEMNNKALGTLRRSSLYATIVTISSIVAGYTHGEFLEDVYNICYFNDYSHSLESYSSLNSKSKEHAEASLKVFKERELYIPKNKFLSRLITYHNEKLEGGGEIHNINISELNDLEKIVIYLESEISENEYEFTSNDGNKIFYNLFSVNEHDSFYVKKLKESICKEFSRVTQQEQVA